VLDTGLVADRGASDRAFPSMHTRVADAAKVLVAGAAGGCRVRGGAQQGYCFGDMVQIAFVMLQHLNDPCFHPCYGDSTAG